MNHVLQYNMFHLQHLVHRRGAILEALFRIFEGFYFGPQDLIMTSLFHFEEKVHKKNLSRVGTIPLLFLQLLSYVLEHLSFPTEPHCERRRECEATFIVKKWQFVPGTPPLLAFPPTGEDQQVDPPEVQQHPPAPAQHSHSLVSSALVPALVYITLAPITRSSPRAPTGHAGPNTSAPLVEFVHISTQDVLAIMASVLTFAATSQTFAAAHIVMDQRMTRTEAVLTQIQEHLGLPPIPLSPPAASASPAPRPAAPTTSSADPSPAVPPAASAEAT